MSFLSRLFGNDRDDEEEEELEELEEEDEEDEEDKRRAEANLSDLTDGMSLDIMTKEGSSLFTGRLVSFKNRQMTLDRLPGCISFPILPVDEEVTIRGYNKKMAQFIMSAVVQESTRTLCKLKNVKMAVVDNQRNNFRLYMNVPAWLFRESDEKYLRPEECTLVDVSTGGCCVESEYVHEEEEVLRIKLKLEDYQPMYFLGQIIRASETKEGVYRYGILFAQMREDELTALTRMLYNLQVGNRDTKMRVGPGYWT